MFKPSKNPKIEELTNSWKERAYSVSDFRAIKLDGVHKNCIWCLGLLGGSKQKWCCTGCVLSALAWARPTGPYGVRVILYRDNFKCATCSFSYREFYVQAYEKIRNRTYFRFPKIKTKRVEYLIKTFRRLLPREFRLEIDHVVPLSFGGQTLGFKNLQILCSQCHKVKTKKETRERLEKFGNPRKGVKFTDSHRKSLSKVRKGFDSPARRAHREIMYKNMRKPIIAINLITGEELIFCSLEEAAKVLNLQGSNVSRVLRGDQNRKQHKGWTFKYK